MKIKLHKRFRRIVSLLVTVMLLIGIMPTQVWEGIKVEAVTYKVYFDLWSDNDWNSHLENARVNQVKIVINNTEYNMTSGSPYYYSTTTQVSGNIKFHIYFNASSSAVAWNGYTTERPFSSGAKYYINDSNKWARSNIYIVADYGYDSSYVYYKPLTSSNTFSATKDMNIAVNSDTIFKQRTDRHYVKATMYDYFSDYEIINGEKRTNIQSPYDWDLAEKRVPLLTFDKALSSVYENQSYSHPLYFGDIHHEENGYNFKDYNDNWGLVYQNNYKQLYHDNNSLRRVGFDSEYTKSDADVATTGLYATSLSAYNKTASNTTNAARLTLTGGANAKWFDSTWLESGNSTTNKMIGTSYDVDFPFWTINMARTIGSQTYDSCDYYYINSEKKAHALRMSKDKNGAYYLDETEKGIYNYTGNDEDILNKKQGVTTLTTTYGFFPFNDKTDFYTGGNIQQATGLNVEDTNKDLGNLMNHKLRLDRTNYCFGTYMVIPFTLTSDNGTVNGTTDATDTPITFTFSGDDDLLVYIDNQLVLDIGGDHNKVQGEINLKAKKSWVSAVKTNNGTSKSNITWSGTEGLQNMSSAPTSGACVQDLQDTAYNSKKIWEKGEHVMEIFYVERGLFDSNMEIMYNLPVVENRSFTVGQSITTPTVDSVFTSSPNYRTNVSNIRLDMNVQFSEPNNTSTFDKLLDEQTYPGDNPKKITGITGVTEFDSNATTHTYSVKMGNNNTITYLNNFIKPYSYNLKVSEGNIFIKTGSDGSGKEICTDTNRDVSHLFTTSWKLRQLSNAADEKAAQNAGPATTATATTSGSSRPKRATKTTSTSATNNSNGFDFRGTQANPDQIEFYNTMNTYSLRVSKEFHRKTDDTAERTFTIKVYFNNVGGLNLEEPDAATPANGLGIVLEKELTFTFSSSEGTGTDGTTKYKDIVVPANTVYKVIETTDQTSDGYAKSGEVGADGDDPFAEPVLDENNRVSVTVVNRAPQAIILKVQKVWENTTSSTAFPESVKFLVERSTDGATFTSMTSGTVVNASGQVVSNDTLDSNGYLKLTNAYTTNINGNTVWLAYIYDDDNVSTNTYRVTEYDGDTPLGEGATYRPTASSFKVKYSETGFTSESTYTNATETGLTRPSGVNADYGNGSPEGGRVLTLSVINRAFIKIRVQSYFTQADEEQKRATPPRVKMKVQRLNTSSGTWENVVNTENHSTGDVTATSGNVQPEANNRKYFEYILDGEYDPDYTYKVEEYSSSDAIVDGEGVTQFNNVFITVSYNGAGGVKPNQSTGDELDDSWAGVKGITLAIFNSADGSPGNTETGGRGGYIPIAGGFIAILLAGAGYFIYKKRLLV